MSDLVVEYQGRLRCRTVHAESGVVLITDAPRDNHGEGEGFSPSDLLGVALGSCILSVMGIVARNHDLDIAGATATVEKEMASLPSRTIMRLAVTIHMPRRLTDEHARRLEAAAHTCPIHRSLHPDLDAPIHFVWGVAPAA
ncbi:MAG: OsmC family protein [Candidatus Sphingomonas colombiensis]|nr:OsmC family protein [Sphingomonas sp.]WEK43525.1 MAG: OsmC family protein [Sphingomonas sp.]